MLEEHHPYSTKVCRHVRYMNNTCVVDTRALQNEITIFKLSMRYGIDLEYMTTRVEHLGGAGPYE